VTLILHVTCIQLICLPVGVGYANIAIHGLERAQSFHTVPLPHRPCLEPDALVNPTEFTTPDTRS